MQPLKNKKSFTVIELVIVIVVLGICLAPVGLLFYGVMQKYAQPQSIQIASALAEGEMERVTSLDFTKIVNSGPTAFVDFPNFTWQILVSAYGALPTAKYKQIEVRIVNSSLNISVSLFTVCTAKQ